MAYTKTSKVLSDVYEQINWAYLAKTYFGKPRSWLYHKFEGTNNGIIDDFSDIDRDTLKTALLDIAKKIAAAANNL